MCPLNLVVLGLTFKLRIDNAEGVQHRSPGQAHVSETNVRVALGTVWTQRIGRANDAQYLGRSAEAAGGPRCIGPAVRIGYGRRDAASTDGVRMVAFLLGRCARQYLFWGGAKARDTRLRSAPGYVVKRRWRTLVDGFVGQCQLGHSFAPIWAVPFQVPLCSRDPLAGDTRNQLRALCSGDDSIV